MDKQIGLIITDSMGMPREKVLYKDCWPNTLKNIVTNVNWVELFKRGSLMSRLKLEGPDLLEYYNPTIVLIQLGIVDCAPRKLSYFENKIINNLPLAIQRITIFIFNILRKRKKTRTYTSVVEFKNSVKSYCERAQNLNIKKILFIEISPVGESMISKSEDIMYNIKIYNNIIKEVVNNYDNCELVQIFKDNEKIDNYTVDGYHFNSYGHSLISRKIVLKVKECLH